MKIKVDKIIGPIYYLGLLDDARAFFSTQTIRLQPSSLIVILFDC